MDELTTVKIITVNPGESLSLQYHNKREEFWRILSGKGKCVIGEETIEIAKGDEFFIPKKTKHRMTAEKESVEWMEISFGKFEEEDIVRLEDKYKRV